MTWRGSKLDARVRRRRGVCRGVFGLVALALLTHVATATPRAAAATCAGSSVFVVAHEDDSILFQDPDLRGEIAAGRCVRTIFVTAGDAGSPNSSYWLGREAGAKAAYAQIMKVSNTWTQSDAGVAGHPIPVFVSAAQPRVSLAFMRLPDGNIDGSGYATTGYRTLEKLWVGSVGSITTVDGTSTYSRSDLISVLGTLIAAAGADRIVTQDFVGTYGDGDHSDHHTTAYLTRSASRADTTPHLLVGYEDYGISSLPANLTATQSQAKQDTFLTYAPHDPNACQAVPACQTSGYAPWWQREYTVGAEFSAVAPTVAQPGTTVTLTGAGFTGASAVSFNGLAASFKVVSNTRITAVVPTGAQTGLVTVTTTLGAATSPGPLTVLGTPGSNVAAAATVTASSESTATGQLAIKAVDGFTDGYTTGDYTHEWSSNGEKAGAWLNLQWSSPQQLGSITLFDRPNTTDEITAGTITFSDGSTLNVPSLPDDGTPLTLAFATKTVTSLRLTVTGVSASTGNVGLAEIQTRIAVPGAPPTPTLTGFSPSTGPVGTTVTLTGSGFTGATAAAVNGTSATYTVTSDTQAQLVVPAGATSGPLSITTPGGTATSTGNFTVATAASSNVAPSATVTASTESPSTGQLAIKAVDGFTDGYSTGDYTHEWASNGEKAGAWLNLQWSSPQQLGSITLYDRPNADDQITGGTITFSDGSTLTVPTLPNNGTPLTLAFPTKTVTSLRLTITAVSASTRNIGLAEIQAWTGAAATKPPAPQLTGFSPSTGPVGTTVTLTGSGFTGATAAAVNGTSATYTVTSDTQAQLVVPAHATSGPLSITTPGGTATSTGNFTLATAASSNITGFSPSTGPVGTTVTLTGSGFTGATAAAVNGTSATYTVTSDTQAQLVVPAGATSGPLSITTPGGTATSTGNFTVATAASSNVAPSATVTASTESPSTGQLAIKAVDGFTDGYSTGDYTHEWASNGEKAGAWLNLQWSSPQQLGSITLYDRPNADDQITGGTITFSDGSTLTVPTLPNNGTPLTLAFPTKTVTSLRLTITAVSASTRNIGLAEIQAWTG